MTYDKFKTLVKYVTEVGPADDKKRSYKFKISQILDIHFQLVNCLVQTAACLQSSSSLRAPSSSGKKWKSLQQQLLKTKKPKRKNQRVNLRKPRRQKRPLRLWSKKTLTLLIKISLLPQMSNKILKTNKKPKKKEMLLKTKRKLLKLSTLKKLWNPLRKICFPTSMERSTTLWRAMFPKFSASSIRKSLSLCPNFCWNLKDSLSLSIILNQDLLETWLWNFLPMNLQILLRKEKLPSNKS